jgi:hypothetical protein
MHFSIFRGEKSQESRLHYLKYGGKELSETSLVDYQLITHHDPEEIGIRQQRNKSLEHASLIAICICSV